MRRLLPLLLILIILGPSWAFSQEKPAPITINWHGQSFFIIKSSKGTVVATDPHLLPAYGRPEGLKADAVTFSHYHHDHVKFEVFENAMTLKKIVGLTPGPQQKAKWVLVDETIKDVRIRNVGGVFHDEMQGMRYGKNSIFIIEMDGWRIVHLGDLGHQLNAEQIKAIGPVDVLMIPVGGIYTLNGSEAKKVVEQLKPKEYIFPMHMGTKVYPDDLLGPDEFLDGQDRARITSSTDNKIVLNRDPQRPRPLITLLHYWPDTKKENEKEKTK